MGLFSIQNADFIKEDELVFVSGDKQETGERKGTVTETEKRHRKQKQRQKMNRRKKERAITYLSESERMNMEEPNDSKVQSSKCFTNYQAAANRINMILF